MTKSYQVIAGIIGITLIIQGCGNATQTASPLAQPAANPSQASEPGEALQLTAPASLEADPEAAAAALADPDQVEKGVWFLLRGLGIGVYTGDGKQILAGSETKPEDFWIYDFEVPLLVRLAKESPRPFSEFQPQLHNLGLEASQEETLKLYKDIYEANSSAYLARLFAAMGLQFEGDPAITPLQEWLLLLDTFVPPNPSVTTRRDAPSRVSFTGSAMSALSRPGMLLGLEALTRFAQTEPCGWIQGGVLHSSWGLVQSNRAAAADVFAAAEAYYAIHGPLLARSVTAKLMPSEGHAHEGHGAPGDSITFEITLDIDYRAEGFGPIWFPTCGPLVNLDRPLKSGGLPPAKVWWNLDSVFKDHGSFNDVRGRVFDGSRPTETDPSGKTSITFQARQEPANGKGEPKSSKATVRASFDPRPWIAAMGLNDPRLLAFLPATIHIPSPEPVRLEWHGEDAYEVDGVYWGAYHLTGTICGLEEPFTLHAEQNLGGEPGVGEFVFTPTSISGGDWKYAGTMCGEGTCFTVDGSSTFQWEDGAEEAPGILMDSGSNWTVTAPLVGTFPLGEGRHLGTTETIKLEPASAECQTE